MLEQTPWGQSNENAITAPLIERSRPEPAVEWFNWGADDLISHLESFRNADADVIIGIMSDLVSREQDAEMTRKSVDLAKQHDCNRFLIDWTEAKWDFSVTELYDHTLEHPTMGVEQSFRVAIVTGNDRKMAEFFENVVKNNALFAVVAD